ncbi:MAG: hypothetical protein ACYTAO_02470 [Planctomycetota bacterium]|jgi:hypothetical protein
MIRRMQRPLLNSAPRRRELSPIDQTERVSRLMLGRLQADGRVSILPIATTGFIGAATRRRPFVIRRLGFVQDQAVSLLALEVNLRVAPVQGTPQQQWEGGRRVFKGFAQQTYVEVDLNEVVVEAGWDWVIRLLNLTLSQQFLTTIVQFQETDAPEVVADVTDLGLG